MNNYQTNPLGAYLDSFYIVKLKIKHDFEVRSVVLVGEEDTLLENINTNYYQDYKVITLRSNDKINPQSDYVVLVNNELKFHLNVGAITLTKEFEKEYFFNDWLGFKYTKSNVTFRLYAPVSKEVVLVINENKTYLMNQLEKGVYEVKVTNKNEWLDGASYYFEIRNDEVMFDVIDPYGMAINSEFTRCFIFDKKKTYQLKHSYVSLKDNNKENSIIYEMSVRDFTISLPLLHKGEFLGIVESSEIEGQGINYIKDLGITHVQLGPVFAFGGVNYIAKSPHQPNFKYNWGYNPILYNALCGWFASNPNNPYSVINEFKMMVDTFHENNIGVIMDVVYNHVYLKEEYAFGKIVPCYPYRYHGNGEFSNGSWCGNDVASERLMNRKFILDSLKYYQDEFKIDGFRFDLMGLIDIDTINEAKRILSITNKSTLLYGEGWQMPTAYSNDLLAHMFNSSSVPEVGFFNDYFRNTLKGKKEHNKYGILIKGDHHKETIESLFNGNKMFASQTQSINYVECHDNATFFDEQIKLGINSNQAKENAKIALLFVLFSKGISFIHSGQEILRSKQGIDNSYNCPDVINKFPWHLAIINKDLYDDVKELIRIKKEVDFARYNFVKVQARDRSIRVVFEKDLNKLILYINLKENNTKINIGNNEEVIFSSKKINLDNIVLNKSFIITKTK